MLTAIALRRVPLGDVPRRELVEGRSYHVRSAAGLALLAAELHQPALPTDVDFAEEELWVTIERTGGPCEEQLVRSLLSNGRILVPAHKPYPSCDPQRDQRGPMRLLAFAFARQALPVVPARNPECIAARQRRRRPSPGFRRHCLRNPTGFTQARTAVTRRKNAQQVLELLLEISDNRA